MAAASVDSMPPTMQYLPGSVNIPLTQFPPPPPFSVGDVDAAHEVKSVVDRLNGSLDDTSFASTAGLFAKGGYWRDHLMLSWNFRTVQGPSQIAEFLQACSRSKDGFRLQRIAVDDDDDDDDGSPCRRPATAPLDGQAKVLGIRAFLSIETVRGRGDGLIRLAHEDGAWKIFTMYTSLRELRGHEEGTFQRRPRGVSHGGQPGRRNWADERLLAREYRDGTEPKVLIIGAGQAGLTAAVRLKMLGIDALIIDRNQRVGDNWRNRYHQLVLHDPVWYDHMPYLNFPPQWPIFTPKDKLADWFEAYASIMELNVWMRTEPVKTCWDEGRRAWTIEVARGLDDGSTTETRTLRPLHVIQATGHSGQKYQPDVPGTESFAGHLICHSSEFPGAREQGNQDQQGQEGQGQGQGQGLLKAVVVGSCNSAHDIAQDFAEKGYDVTMVQRSSTHVVSSRAVTDIALRGLFSEDGPPVDDADMLVHSMPNSMLKAVQAEVVKLQRDEDGDLLRGLERAGFRTDDGPDGSGLFFKYFQRGGGYYIDVGASRLIVDGRIKVRQGREVSEVLPRGVRLSDGSELEADEVVFATGYRSMRSQTRQIFGHDAAEKVADDVWGLNAEGEWRTMWQRSGHPGLWYHGGNMALCRYYSRLLALQIKGLDEGLYAYDED
ncbi:hypothetical protein EsDP_00003014 [Epichloe bromicola]|uniref:FAD/NAD(P)-binding domain-containing protein n=1 Tax=Epichloe bromicola TaxID=79588 RepID=A0ABQ0CMJ4_9HYPO